ncbi:MAG TPA: DNA-protecting protein DprA, partial [Candidatus Hydrogenedentes bacterium]|nr:DNA-protecting protein DprA [Candidatus Hydrogenedentota bacterium]
MPLDTEHRDWLTLTLVPGVGTTNFIRLLARFRTPGNVLAASEGALKEVISDTLARRIRAYGETADVDAQEGKMDACGATLITLDDPAYPSRLAEIYDPPLALFVRGRLEEPDEPCVAIVGTRRPTPYGIRMAERFGNELAAREITVVSGMAAGIDAAAHRGALAAGGRTIAVLGCGVDVLYPPQNAALMEEIIAQGCVLSEFEMGVRPLGGNFPQRNRIISGLSQGTLIVEAPPSSGALITAKLAAEQGREVFAVPGQVGVRNSQGPHALIREGAKLVEQLEDILVELEVPAAARRVLSPTPSVPPPEPKAPAEPTRHKAPKPTPKPRTQQQAPAAAQVSPEEGAVLKALAPDGSYVDEIAQRCRMP